jgi:hypothetical protein
VKHLIESLGLAALIALAACDSGGGDDATGGCDFAGSWNAPPIGGSAATFVANADGTTLLTLGSAGTVSGTWSLASDVVSLTDTAATGAGTQQQCGAGVVGRYHVGFHDACGAATFTLVSDACAMRSAAVDGLTVTR